MPKKSFRTASLTPENVTPDWGRLLQTRREKLGLSREALALAAGVSPSLIAKLEQGNHDLRDVSVGRLHALLRTLHLPSIDFLLGEGPTEEFTPSAPGITPLPYYSSLTLACAGEEASTRSHFDTRLLPTRPSYTNFFLAILEQDVLRSEDLSLVEGSVLFEAGNNFEIDNMEGLAVHRNAAGETILTLVSDDNFSLLQRTILLRFALIEP